MGSGLGSGHQGAGQALRSIRSKGPREGDSVQSVPAINSVCHCAITCKFAVMAYNHAIMF